jgi:predicted phosphodiesterase
MGSGERVAIISDVHGFLSNLNTALEFIDKKEIKHILCLGDLVGYGRLPNECVDIVKSNGKITCLLGNHDAIATKDYSMLCCNTIGIHSSLLTRKLISAASRDYLSRLPSFHKNNHFCAVHGSLRSLDEYMRRPESVKRNYSIYKQVVDNCGIVFYGHTHLAQVWQISGERIVQVEADRKIKLRPDSTYFINPGSIGALRYSSKSFSFAIYDWITDEVEFIKFKSVDEYLPELQQFASLYKNPAMRLLDRCRRVICKKWSNLLGKNRVGISDERIGNER